MRNRTEFCNIAAEPLVNCLVNSQHDLRVSFTNLGKKFPWQAEQVTIAQSSQCCRSVLLGNECNFSGDIAFGYLPNHTRHAFLVRNADLNPAGDQHVGAVSVFALTKQDFTTFQSHPIDVVFEVLQDLILKVQPILLSLQPEHGIGDTVHTAAKQLI